jgi:hypothetical protein
MSLEGNREGKELERVPERTAYVATMKLTISRAYLFDIA